MILGFDIGNTSTTAGLYRENRLEPDFTFRYPTARDADHGSLAGRIREGIGGYRSGADEVRVSGLAFSSVVPEVNGAYHEMGRTLFGGRPYEITCRSKLNYEIRYDDPAQLGTDRIVNAAAAFHEYGGGDIVVDIGTAVTFCVLLEDGVFDGGIIAPGIDTAIRSLALRASRLPEVPFEKPERLVARGTIDALKSGFFYGWLSLAEGLIGRIEREYGRDFRVILTGGFAAAVAEHLSRPPVVDQLLAMKGIKLIYDMNS